MCFTDKCKDISYSIIIDVQLLTKGSDFLTYEENTTISKHALNILKTPKDLQLSK
jgi:hypothetical protein